MTLKLYVWEDVLCDYTCGVMFALAESVEQAREVIRAEAGYPSVSVNDGLKQEPKVCDTPVGFIQWGGG
jgi:hypothetical protein